MRTVYDPVDRSRTHTTLTLRVETYRALARIREDMSFATYDMVLRDLIRKAYPSSDL